MRFCSLLEFRLEFFLSPFLCYLIPSPSAVSKCIAQLHCLWQYQCVRVVCVIKHYRLKERERIQISNSDFISIFCVCAKDFLYKWMRFNQHKSHSNFVYLRLWIWKIRWCNFTYSSAYRTWTSLLRAPYKGQRTVEWWCVMAHYVVDRRYEITSSSLAK